MNKKFQILLLILFFLLIIKPVKAQELGDFFSISYLWTQVFGLPADWILPQNILFNFIVPFIALYTICLGFLRTLRIFPTSRVTNWVIAFAMAFMTLPSRIFVTIVGLVLGFAGIFAFFVFIAMFIGGSYLYSRGFFRKWDAQAEMYKTYRNNIRRLNMDERNLGIQLNILRNRLLTARPNQIPRIQDEIDQLQEQLETVRDRINALRRTRPNI